jgi:hypothetical protein
LDGSGAVVVGVVEKGATLPKQNSCGVRHVCEIRKYTLFSLMGSGKQLVKKMPTMWSEGIS